MTIKPSHKNSLQSTDKYDEAIKILEEETTRRIEDIQQQVEFMCASIRAQGNTDINKMLKSVRELTLEEFCETFGASTQLFLEQQTKKRIGTDTSRKKSIQLQTEQEPIRIEPFSVQINNETSIHLDPNQTGDLDAFPIIIPPQIQQQLNSTQKERVVQQIQALETQLELVKQHFM
ncbi:hypothetical protein CU098_009100 [Rhizopus stolonifer]|uniref:Borealin N-terminal domain-containing protein n=2 Tax=Mucorineae TaxID=1344963 RepID=A0A367K8Q1_RHIST|nr:hypothetical protein CU098_009100 [Rhizopus stolonifer]